MALSARLATFALVALTLSLPLALADDEKGRAAGDPYPLPTCIVTGKRLGEGSVAHVHEGRQLRFCSKACVEKLTADPEAWLAKLDAALTRDQAALYPLKICPVSGDGLDDKDAATDHVFRNRLVRLCCGSCADTFAEDPKKYFIGLDRAVFEWQEFDYPLKDCLVDGAKLPEEPVDVVIANRLLRVCSKGCAEKLRENPIAAIAKLDAARAKKD